MKSIFKYSAILLTLFLFSCSKEKSSSSIDLNELTIAQIHSAFQNGEYSSEELVKAYLDRIEKYDPQINAITYVNEDALEQARKLDAEFRETGQLRPLHGIPMIVKDNINTVGFPTTAGARALMDYYPEEDAPIIKRLKEAGAILIAKSNMAEWAFSPRHTNSTTHGTTRNPYNPVFVPAGSSGGTGAAIAANFAVIGLGTDTGNSIRGPSSHNALVGFRSSIGLISRSGIVPLYLRNDVVGPMCRTVEDAAKVMEVMAGYDPLDPVTEYSKEVPKTYSENLVSEGLKGARIGVLRVLSDHETDSQIKNLFETALKDLESLGATIVDPVDVPDFDTLRQNQWCAEFRKDLETFLHEYVKNDTIFLLEDVARIGTDAEYARVRIEYFLENSGRGGMPEVPCGDVFNDEWRIAYREAIEHTMDSLQLDALVYPSWNNPPATIENFNDGYLGDNSQIICPHTGQPGFTVPMGYTSGDLPAGLQFLGRFFDEGTLVRLCYAYEKGTLHRKSPDLKEAALPE